MDSVQGRHFLGRCLERNHALAARRGVRPTGASLVNRCKPHTKRKCQIFGVESNAAASLKSLVFYPSQLSSLSLFLAFLQPCFFSSCVLTGFFLSGLECLFFFFFFSECGCRKGGNELGRSTFFYLSCN